MSKRIKEKIGEELYSKLLETGLKENEFDLTDGNVPRSRLNEERDKFKALEGKYTSLENQYKEAEKLISSNKDFESQLASLNEKYATDKSNWDAELKNTSKRYRAEMDLVKMGANPKYTKMMLSQIDFNKLSLENDNLLGFAEMAETMKKDNEELFFKQTTSSNTTPPASSAQGRQSGEKNWDEIFKNF